MLKSNTNMLFKKLNAKQKRKTFQSLIMKKTSTLSNEMIHITPMCNMDLHSRRNKMMPLMKLFKFQQ
jgi:hypothetical protein